MFAMYDDDGLNFRNTIDHLYNIHEVAALHSVNNSTKDKQKQNFKENLYKGKITQEAKEKYKQITNMNTMQEVFHVDQLMSTKITTANDDYTIKECYEMMQERKIQQLPILDNKTQYLKGIVTLNEIIRFIFNNLDFAQSSAEELISKIATNKIITTDPISDIRRVSKVMIDFNINAIPVVNSEDTLVGMVSRNDIVKAVATIPHMQIWA